MNATNVLCPLDGSPQAERALPAAMDAARLSDLPLTLFSAVEDEHMVTRQTDYLHECLGDVAAKVEVVVDPHAPHAISEAGSHSLVVMATSTQPLIHHGYLGSAAESVVRTRDLPTLLVGPRATLGLTDLDRTVACCDGSELSEVALEHGRKWADALDNELWVITVLRPTYESANTSVSEHNYVSRLAKKVDAQWDVLHGTDPARAIASWADTALIVMTSHGRTGWSRLRMGSVTTATVRWASTPVLVLRGQVNGD